MYESKTRKRKVVRGQICKPAGKECSLPCRKTSENPKTSAPERHQACCVGGKHSQGEKSVEPRGLLKCLETLLLGV